MSASTFPFFLGSGAGAFSLPTTKHRDPASTPHVLVEVDWPGGSRRYAGEDLVVEHSTGYDGRIISIGDVHRGTGERQDSVEVTLENLPNLATVESLWSDTYPPENSAVRVYLWIEDEPLANRVEIFRGVVEHIEEVTDQIAKISALSSIEGYDAPLGKLITLTDFADAPEESVGKFEPIVFGTVARMEGIPVSERATSYLAAPALKSDTTLYLQDVSRFPNTGAIFTGTNYSGRNPTTNTLTGCSARTRDFPTGTEVMEVGTLDILLAGHAVTAIDAVYGKKGDSIGKIDPSFYTPMLTAPAKVRFTDSWPKISVPAGGSQFMQVQTDALAAVGTNTALDPLNAAAGQGAWTDKNYATIRDDFTNGRLFLRNTKTIADIGELIRVWVMAEYDPSTGGLHETGGTPDGGIWRLAIAGHALDILTTIGNLSTEYLNQMMALGTTRAYDDSDSVTQPTHIHDVGSGPITITMFFDTLNTVNINNSERIVDKGFVTAATVASTVGGETFTAAIQTLINLGGTPTSVVGKIDAQIGALGPTQYVHIHGPGGDSTNAAIGAVRDVTSTGPLPVTSWADVQAVTMVSGLLYTSTQVWEGWLEVTYTPAASAASVTTDALASGATSAVTHTRATATEVTSYLATKDWADLDEYEFCVEYVSGSPVADLKVVRLSIVVEYAPTKLERCDRVFADVRGLIPDGMPTDILKEVVTNAYLMNLTDTEYNLGDFTTAQMRLVTLLHRLDFVVYDQPKASELIASICEQGRLLYFWEEGKLCVRFREVIASLDTALVVYQQDGDLIPESVKRVRSVLRDVVTELTVRYGYSSEHGKLDKTYTKAQTVALTTRKDSKDLELVTDATSAQNYADWSSERTCKPRYTISFMVHLPGLEVRRGDILSIVTTRFTYSKIEVLEITISEQTYVTIVGLVLDAIT